MNEIIASGLRLYFKYFGIILALVLAIGLPCQLLTSYVSYEIIGKERVLLNLQLGAFIELIFGIVLTGGILQALFVDRMDRRASFLECLSESINHWFQLCWTNFLMTALLSALSILFFLPIGTWVLRLIFLIPAFFLSARLSLSLTIVMVEGEWGATALRRSLRLTMDRVWKILGLGFVVYLPLQAVGFIGVRMLQTDPALDNWQFTAAFGTFLKLISCLIPICFFRLYETLVEADNQAD